MEHASDPSMSDGLATWSVVVGCGWLVLAGAYLLQPEALGGNLADAVYDPSVDLGTFWRELPRHVTRHAGLHVAALAASLVTLGYVPALTRWIAGGRPGAGLRASASAATLGQAVIALSNVRYLAFEAHIAERYAVADAAGRRLLEAASSTLALDPYGVLEFGAVGVWVAAATWAARPSPGLLVSGAAASLGFLGMVGGACVGSTAAQGGAAVLGGVGFPVWCLLFGARVGARERM